MTEALKFYDNVTSGKPYTTYSHKAFKYYANMYFHSESCLNMRKHVDYTNGHTICNKLLLELGLLHKHAILRAKLHMYDKILEREYRDIRPFVGNLGIATNMSKTILINKSISNADSYMEDEDGYDAPAFASNIRMRGYTPEVLLLRLMNSINETHTESPRLNEILLNLAKYSYHGETKRVVSREILSYNYDVSSVEYHRNEDLFNNWKSEYSSRKSITNTYPEAILKDKDIKVKSRFDFYKLGLQPASLPPIKYTHNLEEIRVGKSSIKLWSEVD